MLDTSFICVAIILCLGSFLLQALEDLYVLVFKGQSFKYSVNVLLTCNHIVTQGSAVVSMLLFNLMSLITNIIFIFAWLFFRDCRGFICISYTYALALV